jgi:mannose-6-phosphate isomerase
MPVGAKHGLSSPGPAVRVVEIAFGNWQQEDIMRFSDDHQRPSKGE